MYQIKINLRCRERDIARRTFQQWKPETYAKAALVVRMGARNLIQGGKAAYVKGRRAAGVERARQALRICKGATVKRLSFSTLLITGGN